MSRSWSFMRGLLVAGAGAAVLARRRAAERRADEALYDLGGDRTEPTATGAAYGGYPALFHRSDSFQTYHAADYDAIVDALPTRDLYPVRLPGGRAIVLVGAFQYGDITAAGVDGLAALPYGEVMVATPVTRRPAPPLVPLVAPASTPFAAGGFVLHLPVTTRVARDWGRLLFGLPKFIADMAFDDGVAEKRVRVAEGGRDILELSVRPGGRPTIVRESTSLYSVLDGRLMETVLPSRGIRQLQVRPRAGRLELGDHPVAAELRRLGIDPHPVASVLMTAERFVFPKGRPLGAAEPYPGYAGEERDLGRYIVRYPNAAPIDRYAPFARTAGPEGTLGIGRSTEPSKASHSLTPGIDG